MISGHKIKMRDAIFYSYEVIPMNNSKYLKLQFQFFIQELKKLGNNDANLMLSIFKKNIVILSRPNPAPPCNGDPCLKDSKYSFIFSGFIFLSFAFSSNMP